MAFVMQRVCGLTLVAVLCLSFLALLPAHILLLLPQGCAGCTLACLYIVNAVDVVWRKEACGVDVSALGGIVG
jgi:hypothetical protein